MKNEAKSPGFMGARSTFYPSWLSADAPRLPTQSARPVVWSIAGSDSAAGAGLQADLKALQAFGVHGCTVVAAITAQNSVAVTRVEPVSADMLDAQLAALAQDMPPQAIKTGMLGSVDNLRVVCQWVDRLRAQGHPVALVVDPVLGSTTGAQFADDALVQAYVQELLTRATLVTPNRAEAQRLGLADWGHQAPPAGQQPTAHHSPVGLHAGLQALRAQGVSVAVTGGDASTSWASDWCATPQAVGWLGLPHIATVHQHGTGCTFAATAAAALASGYCEMDALVLAKMATAHALRHGYAAGQGAGPVQALADFALHAQNLPVFTAQPPAAAAVFAPLENVQMGVYAVVDSAAWLQRVLAAGIRTVQLRIKDAQAPDLAAQIADAVATARAVPGAQLFINDHWQLALTHGAYGVHLGQEDLAQVDLAALQQAGVRLGLSTHSYWEVARAWGVRPSYIACGPLFPTQSKSMPWLAQGLGNARYWAQTLPVPVVGIGGIDVGRMADVAATGVAGAAVISAITQAGDPEAACHALMAAFARGRTSLEESVTIAT
jgi:hydroxymethylpyrimidine kinase / phosphomethylpyrimidine kinase / thiamine-phosphate diphosphorylase